VQRHIDNRKQRKEHAEKLYAGLNPGILEAREADEKHGRIDHPNKDEHGKQKIFRPRWNIGEAEFCEKVHFVLY
jgi:hypothetical protein